MNSLSKKVFVLGAGFTKAFLPDSPLLIDTYDVESVVKRHEGFDAVAQILQRERDRLGNGLVDIERLLSRLEGMPFDSEKTLLLLESVKADIHNLFLAKLRSAKERNSAFEEDLKNFSYFCLVHNVTCITFNYDDVLDAALHETSKCFAEAPGLYWHPNSGYGFYIPPSSECIRDPFWANNERSALIVHKLHGSMNWRTKLGFSRPYPIDALVHHENWNSFKQQNVEQMDFLEPHLREGVFIVPPVISKTSLQEPILRRVWERAYQALLNAEEVTFIGYSCPVTDLAASFLFGHTIDLSRQAISVIDKVQGTESQRQKLRDSYRQIIPSLHFENFQFTGALEWVRTTIGNSRGVLSDADSQEAAKHILQFLDQQAEPQRSAAELTLKIGASAPKRYEQVVHKLIEDRIISKDNAGRLFLWRRPEDPKFCAFS